MLIGTSVFVDRHAAFCLIGMERFRSSVSGGLRTLVLEALRRRHKVKLTTAAALVTSLAEAERIGTLARRLSIFTGHALLVVNEIGFLPLDAHQTP